MIRDLLPWLFTQIGWHWIAIWLAAILLLMLWPAKRRLKEEGARPDSGSCEETGNNGWRNPKTRLRMLAVILAGALVLWFGMDRWREYRKMERWKAEDSAERQNAPEWKYQLADFQSEDRQRDIEAKFRKDGFNLRCFQGHGILAQDATMCWFNAKPTTETPVEAVAVFFNIEGKLNAIRLEAARDRYDELSGWLSRSGKKLKSGFGIDGLSGKPVEAWIFEQGLAMTSNSPDQMDSIMVYWMNRQIIMRSVVSGSLISGIPQLIPGLHSKLTADANKEILSHWN